MNLKLLLVPAVVLVLQSTAVRAQVFYANHSEILAALQSHPLVVMLQVEDHRELKRMSDKPVDLAQYKADVALRNVQVQQLISRFWTVSPTIEFKPESELSVLEKDKQNTTLVLRYIQQRLGYGGKRLDSYLDTKWYLSLIGGRRDVFSFSTPFPPTAITAADIVSALRNLQSQIRDEQIRMTKTERPRARVQLQEYSQRLRTKTLLIDKDMLKRNFSEADLQNTYPYPHQLATSEEIETAVLAADPRYTYVRNLSSFSFIVDAATGEQLAGVDGDEKWGKGEFAAFKSAVKRGE